MLQSATLCGFERQEEEGKGPKVYLNPPANMRLRVDDSYVLLVPCEGLPRSFRLGAPRELAKEHAKYAEGRKVRTTVRTPKTARFFFG